MKQVSYFDDDKTIYMEEYLNRDGNYHREHLPAIIEYNQLGNIVREEWFFDGEEHNVYGPAVIYYNGDKISSVLWYIYGIEYYFNDWYTLLTDEEAWDNEFNIEYECYYIGTAESLKQKMIDKYQHLFRKWDMG